VCTVSADTPRISASYTVIQAVEKGVILPKYNKIRLAHGVNKPEGIFAVTFQAAKKKNYSDASEVVVVPDSDSDIKPYFAQWVTIWHMGLHNGDQLEA
jgi:hypothetical protein